MEKAMKRALLAAAMMAALLPASVRAEDSCADRDKIVAKLGSEYNETAGSRGLTHKGAVLEIFTSREGSWTIIVTTPTAGIGLRSCLVAHGESWESLPLQLAQGGETS
jgi:hypothetical protein